MASLGRRDARGALVQVVLRSSARVLLDMQAPEEVGETIRRAIESEGDNRIADLHVWSVGPGIYAAEIAIVSSRPLDPDSYYNILPRGLGLVHVTVETHPCAAAHVREALGDLREASMGLKSFDRHKESLRDGREVYFDGERVADVTSHPVLGVGMAFAGIEYKLAEDPGHRDLAVCTDPRTGRSAAGSTGFPKIRRTCSSAAN